MHQETLLYMWHRLPPQQKRVPPGLRYERGSSPPREIANIPAGAATLGADRAAIPFGWDNEFGEHRIDVGAFEIDVHNVTNGEFLEFIDAGGYRTPDLWSAAGWQWRETEAIAHPDFWVRDGSGWRWRGMFENIELPLSWPVYVSHEEAAAFARWRGRRLPTEAEYHRAAFGTPEGGERQFPWGDAAPDASRGNFDFASWEPVPAGARPHGASAWGVQDLVGNGWEWTSTVFGPFPGFEPMASYPEYSADFFDGQHYVMKGASPATARELVRRSFRNWFRPNYPYVYAKFRTALS
jgi:ergothioneine biosynthesis protein EgtB